MTERIIINAAYMALKEMQEAMKGEAEKAAIYTEDDVNKLIDDIRGELWESKNEGND